MHAPLIVTLTKEQYARAEKRGKELYAQAAKGKYKRRYGAPVKGLAIQIQGAVGELAASIALRRKWVGETENFGEDVEGGIQVRTTDTPYGKLIVHKPQREDGSKGDSPDARFVLVRGPVPCGVPHMYEVVGWQLGSVCQRARLWDKTKPTPAYFVPAYLLRNPRELVKETDT